MNEADWDSCTDPQAMLTFLRNRGLLTERKARLFAVACCRRIWHLLADEKSRRAVEVGEQYADGQLTDAEVDDARENSSDAGGAAHRAASSAGWSASSWTANAAANAAYCVLFCWQDWLSEACLFETHIWAARTVAGPTVEGVLSDAARPNGLAAEGRAQCQVLRDIVGNPFRPAKLAPSVFQWNGGTVERLAEEAYQERLLPAG